MTEATPSFEDILKGKLAAKGKTLEDVVMPGAGKKAPAAVTPHGDFSDDVPDVEEEELVLSAEDKEIDNAIKSLSIVNAYNRWSGKTKVHPRGSQKEGIKVNCPDPNHRDEDPSAWINTEKNLYYCSGCEYGGDVWDIAAFYFGYPVPEYKTSDIFRELREKVALDLGYSVVKSMTGSGTVFMIEEPDHEVAQPKVTAKELKDYYKYTGPTIDWPTVVPAQTFLHDWMTTTTQDNCPEEYHFWTGLMAIGYAVGRNVVLEDEPQVNSNLFVCLTGPTSVGKSKAKRHLKNVIQDALPYDESNPLSQGVKMIGAPGSGEYMVKAFSVDIPDPINPKKSLGLAPVRGYIDFEEFSMVATVASRQGSTLKQHLLDIFDCHGTLISGSLTHGTRKAINPYGQVISSTQPDAMAKFLNKDDDVSGFVNRWIFALGKPKRIQSWGSARVDLSAPTKSLKGIHVWGATHRVLSLDEDAMVRWDEFFYDTLLPMKMASEKKNSGIMGRIDLMLKKLILLFACNSLESKVSLDSVNRALQIFPYLIGTMGHTEKKISRTDDGDLTTLIIEKIQEHFDTKGTYPTKRDIYQAVRHKVKTDDQMVKVLKNMISLELITETAFKPKTGRPTIRYSIGAPEEREKEEAK